MCLFWRLKILHKNVSFFNSSDREGLLHNRWTDIHKLSLLLKEPKNYSILFVSSQGVKEARGYLVWVSRPLIRRFRASPTGRRIAPWRPSESRFLKGGWNLFLRIWKDFNLALILLAVKARTKQYPMLRTLRFNYLNLYCLFYLQSNLSETNCFLS